MKIIIIAGGDYKPCYHINDDDFVICADHGYDYAVKYGIKADVVLGDFDSATYDVSKLPEKIVYPTHKDFTDSEAAVCLAMEKNPDEIVLLGCVGSRLDHSLANIQLLKKIAEAGIKASIVNEKNTVYYYRDFFSIKNKIGKNVSLIPLTGEISGIYTKGLEYELVNGTVKFGETLGVSNVVISNDAEYKSKCGDGLIIFSED